ncbi:hypothetical protein BD408DRAFT_426099 [Parasitella parasitica]|nr:hypothetical protein BD408DRAFT_426099 [Parasitella parasitica]
MQYQSRPQENWDHSKVNMAKTPSTGSTAYSISSSSSRQTSSSLQEASARTYFVELEKYLYSLLTKEAAEGVSTQRSAARQKLTRLNSLQFHELATDVYDELMRRNLEKHKSFLELREDFHPRRNQARQKLATLPDGRFKDLASDVYHELKRRYPHIAMEDELPPMPQHKKIDTKAHPSQSTNIIPVKGMISVESADYSDEDEGNGRSSVSDNGNTQSLDSLMADLGNMVKTPRFDMKNSTDVASIRYEYESRINQMAKRIKMLELSLDSDTSTHAGQSRIKQMQEEYKQLDSKYSQLNTDHREQQVAVREVKNEIKQLVEELKSLSDKNENLRIQNEKADIEIRSLSQETRSWRRKYETISMELRSFKTRSIAIEGQDLSTNFLLKPTPNGAIDHQFIIDYQSAIDELMKTSRSSKPPDVLLSMRTIVMACKAITTEVEDYEVKVGLTPADQDSLYNIKNKFSVELTNLLASAKNFAAGMGVGPVSLLDAAAGNLTSTIVELVKLLGMRPIDDNDNIVQSLSVSKEGSKAVMSENSLGDILGPNQLSQFLKTETDHIVSSVQSLLGALRSSDGNLYDIITSIVKIVFNIIQTSQKSFSAGQGLEYKNQGSVILSDLEKCNTKIIRIRDASFIQSPENATAIDKRNLAQESYEIAKHTKELINMLDA